MRLDLAERLRCPRPHEPTPLVIVASHVVERELVRGSAGCMRCRYEARFEAGDLLADGAAPSAAPPPPTAPPSPEAIERLMALLALAEPGGAVLLLDEAAAFALALAAAAGVSVITDGAATPRTPGDAVAALVGFGDALPFADGTFRGAAVGAGAAPALVAEAERVTTRGGRIVGAAAVPLPPGLTELARDDREWVAEVSARPAIVGLSRREPGRRER